MDLPRSLGLEIRTALQESHGSATYQVTDISVGEHRVLRVLTPRCISSRMIFPCITDAHVYTLFQSQALACYYRVFQCPGSGTIYLTRELCKEPLGCFIQSYRESCLAMSEYTVLKIAKQILEGLRYLHEPKYRSAVGASPRIAKQTGAPLHMDEVIHGRLHLNNVMLRWDGSVALCDMAYLFPNSTPYSSSKYSFASNMAVFIAPEALEKGMWGPKSDLWSLGMLIYTMCTLQAPDDIVLDTFTTSLYDDPLLARYSPQLREILVALLSVTPGVRPTASDLLRLPLFSKVKDTKITLDGCNLLTTDAQIPFSDLTELMSAASSGDYEKAMAHLDQCGLATLLGKTALMYAAQHGHATLVPLLIGEARLHILNRDSPAYGKTALMYAASKNYTSIVSQLIPTEAKMQTGRGKTALMMAAEKGHVQAIELLVPHEKGMRTNIGLTALMLAVIRHKWAAVEVLVPFEKKIRTKSRNTALMVAARHNIPESLKYLLATEGRMTRKNGRTALMIAAATGSVEFVNAMVSLFATEPSNAHLELRMCDKQGFTALIHAARNGQATCMRLLIDLEHDILDNKKHSVVYHTKYWIRKAKDARAAQAGAACMAILIEKGLVKSNQVSPHASNNKNAESDTSVVSALGRTNGIERSPRLSVVLPNDELQDLAIFEAASSLDASVIFMQADVSLSSSDKVD